jgi:glycosyltransferase involved in cell wall biosynthesis
MIGISPQICDTYSLWSKDKIDPEFVIELHDSLTARPSSHLNIYHLNADEIDPVLLLLQHSLPDGAYNILYPFWELSKYPAYWTKKLLLFDEIWACSRFIENAIRGVITKPVYHMPLPVNVQLASMQGRQYFGLPEDAYLFLFFFDIRSYIDRKNPGAVIKAFEHTMAARPGSNARVVIKVNGLGFSKKLQQDYAEFVRTIVENSIGDKVILIANVYSDNEIKNLIRCCDCFISLHRSEGYGLGLAEAMYLGKPVIATGYSGNLDFMTGQNSCLVDYELIPVRDGQYLFAEGQVWADPDLVQAVYFMQKMLDDPGFGRRLGQLASRHIRTHFSYLAMGLRYKERLDQLSRE